MKKTTSYGIEKMYLHIPPKLHTLSSNNSIFWIKPETAARNKRVPLSSHCLVNSGFILKYDFFFSAFKKTRLFTYASELNCTDKSV
jgi:hypothetical protein